MSKQKMVRVAESEVSTVVYEPYGFSERKTFKKLHAEAQERAKAESQLLTDLLLLEPSLSRFRHNREPSMWGLFRGDGWNRAAIKEAADLLRADAEDKAKRDRVAAFIKKEPKK